MKNFLIFCSGAKRDILAHCPTEEGKYVGLGGAVLTTALMAALSSALTLLMAFPAMPNWAAALFGLFWGAVVFNIDRWLVSSSRRQKNFLGEVRAALPRIFLALLFGAIISEPLVLQVFSPEIEKQMAVNRAQARQEAQEKADANPRYKEIDTLKEAGKGLRAQIGERKAQRDVFYKEYIEEITGESGTGRPGRGSVAAEKLERLKQADAELAAFKNEIADQAQAYQGRIDRLQAQKDAELAGLDALAGAATGLLARMHALHQLVWQDSWLFIAHALFALFIMTLDCLPVFAKLTQSANPRRPYDTLLEAEEDRALQMARIHTEDAEASADMEIAVLKEQYRVLEEMEIANSRDQAEQISAARAEMAQEVIDAWKPQARQHIQQNLHQYVGTTGPAGRTGP